MNEAERKTAIREAMRQRRRMLSEEDIREAEAVLSKQFIAPPDKDLKRVISDAQVIALYKSVHNELPCDGIAEFFASNGRTVCYPRVKGDDMSEFIGSLSCAVHSLDAALVERTDVDVESSADSCDVFNVFRLI